MQAHPHTPPVLTALPSSSGHQEFLLVMHRLDQHSQELSSLRTDVKEIRGELHGLNKEINGLRSEIAQDRLQTRAEMAQQRQLFVEALAALRAESKVDMKKMGDEFRADMKNLRDESRADMKELVGSLLSTVDDRIRLRCEESNFRLFKWCTGSAATSSVGASGLAYLLSKHFS